MRNNVKEKLAAIVDEYMQDAAPAMMDAMRDRLIAGLSEEYKRALRPDRQSAVIINLGVTTAIDEICAMYGVTLDDMKGRNNTKPMCIARHHLCFRLVRELKLGPTTVGRLLQRNHATISNGVARHAESLADMRYAANV